jgi:putative aminopeptidase FrvX
MPQDAAPDGADLVMELIRELVAVPGPPGQESAIRALVAEHVEAIGCVHTTDARGNLLVAPPGVSTVPEQADIVVMAHLDEIALIVVQIEGDGRLQVTSLGGAYPWKWGEGPMTILTPGEPLTGILSFCSIHTNAPGSAAMRLRENALTWDDARIFTGLTPKQLTAQGVRPGTRVCLHPSRRGVTTFGDFIAAPFLDDRADLAAMLLALEALTDQPVMGKTIVFAATAAEEVGGLGALYLLRRLNAEVGIALEVGPRVPESPFALDGQPTVWVNDGYSAMQAADIELVAEAARQIGQTPHWQALSRGGSDASCAASHGLLARPITLAFAAENSHGYEITHRDAVSNLATLTHAVLQGLASV